VEKERLDPWGTTAIKDYDRLQAEFGIQSLDGVLPRFKKLSLHMRRGIDFGQRDLGRIADAIERDEPFAIMSGIKPTGPFHLGTKMTADDMVFFQSLSRRSTVFYAIADVEAYNDNGISFHDSAKIAVENTADLLALGLDPGRAIVYKQSEEMRVNRLASIFSRGVTNNMLRAIYGERQIGLYLSALIQIGDIFMPQLPELGGPKPVVVPVGADQDPHIRLARDLAARYRQEFGFIPPSAIYHKLFKNLSGDAKMSKRASAPLTLQDPSALASKKVMDAFTGGRATVEEQRRIGGEADKCPVYDLYNFHFALQDDYAKRVYDECVGGIRLCGECKKEAAGLVRKAIEEHRKKRDSLKGEAEELLIRSRRHLSSVSS
jgi:tryptophanyl-tRNA synthetase